MPTAILFPGQGSQTAEMRDRVAELRPDLLEIAGEEAFARADEDTRFAQPAIVAASLANWSEMDERPTAVAGHSLGELSALAAARAISERDAIRLAALRGRLMSGCRSGSMFAVLGAEDDLVAHVAEQCGVTIANDNAPGQIVLSGERAGLRRAVRKLKPARTLELNVSGAFHSPLMEEAVAPFVAVLAATTFRTPRIEVWSAVTAAPLDDPRRRLAEALTAPVRWRETVAAMHDAGIERFVDAGPGQAVGKMVKRILREPARV